ncbi:oligosaccharide MFS transporter [Photobacterium sanctipauli]|nr:oligosaccharide MFS transporter [Photobacterium sanctipauli]
MNRKIYILSCMALFMAVFTVSSLASLYGNWLEFGVGLSRTEIGIVQSRNALLSLLVLPLFGVISDKLGSRKNLIYTIGLLFAASYPFVLYVYKPLLQSNFTLGALVGALYIASVWLAGLATIDSFFEKVSRRQGFEFGQARVFASFGWAVAAIVAGYVIAIDPDYIFVVSSISGLLFIVVASLIKEETATNSQGSSFNLATLKEVSKTKDFWGICFFSAFVISIYNMYDLQFSVFFTSLFDKYESGVQFASFVIGIQTFFEGIMMFICAGLIVKFGAKNCLIFAGVLTAFRMIMTGVAPYPTPVTISKLLHAVEWTLILLSMFKYIASMITEKACSTVYLVGSVFVVQFFTFLFSGAVGGLYDEYGFEQTYIWMGIAIFIFTCITALILTNDKKGANNATLHPAK